jgi:predicted transcriptional regulator of viral defense system
MGKQIHLAKIESLFDKSLVVDFKSIERIVKVNNRTNNYAKLLISNLIKKGKIRKVGKGVYTKHNESAFAVFAFKPAYLGLQSSLSYLGLWEQETIPVILTTKKVRRGIRSILGSNVLVRNIDKRYFFGFDLVKEGNFYLPYSDLEKTVIDLVIFNEKIELKALKEIKKRINLEKLNTYLRRYPQSLKDKVKKHISLKIN